MSRADRQRRVVSPSARWQKSASSRAGCRSAFAPGDLTGLPLVLACPWHSTRHANLGFGRQDRTTAAASAPYEDKIARRASACGPARSDRFSENSSSPRLSQLRADAVTSSSQRLPFERTRDETLALAPQIVPEVADVAERIHAMRERGDSRLRRPSVRCSNRPRTYPFVTSSNCLAGAARRAAASARRSRLRARNREGLHDARRGGPFPTELTTMSGRGSRNAARVRLGDRRPRRCGWLTWRCCAARSSSTASTARAS